MANNSDQFVGDENKGNPAVDGARADLSQKLTALISRLTKSENGYSNALTVFGIRVGGAFVALAMQVLLARFLGVEQYGVFVLVWVVTILLGMFACLGFQTSIIRFFSEYLQKGDHDKLSAVLIAAPLISFCSALFLAIGGYWIATSQLGLLEEVYVAPFALAMVSVPLLALEEVQDGIARALERPLIALAPSFIVRPALIICFTFVLIRYGLAADAVTAIAAALCATLIATCIQCILLWRVVRVHLREIGASRTVGASQNFETKYWFKVSLPVFLSAGFYHVLAHSDVLFLGALSDPQSVAVYYAAIKVLALLHFVLFAVRAASGHHFSRLYTAGTTRDLAAYVGRMAAWTFWPTLVFALMMILMAEPFLFLFGEQFMGNTSLVILLAIGIVARASVGPAESLLSMTKAQNVTAFILALTLMCNIILNLVLIPKYGVHGAAMATSASMIFEALALYAMVLRTLEIRSFFIFGQIFGEARQVKS